MPPIHTQDELYDRWRLLVGDLAPAGREMWARPQLWVAFFDVHGTQLPQVVTVDDLPPQPTPEDCGGTLGLAKQVVESLGGGSVALLLARPGRHVLTQTDRLWAKLLVLAARQVEVPMHPVHLATDDDVSVFAPDDLATAHM